jgi:hypothetical protein
LLTERYRVKYQLDKRPTACDSLRYAPGGALRGEFFRGVWRGDAHATTFPWSTAHRSDSGHAGSRRRQQMRILVTGGAGYVGSVLTRVLLDRGYQVRVVDRGFFGLDHLDARAELIVGDILDFGSDWLDGVGAVIHLAGLSNDPMAAFSPSLNYTLNAAGAAIVAQATKDAGISRFIFSSTCSVYGIDDGEPVGEDHPTNPSHRGEDRHP